MDKYITIQLFNIINNKSKAIFFLLIGICVYSILNINQVPVFYLPDLLLFIFFVTNLDKINRLVSPLVLLFFLILFGFLIFSPQKFDFEYTNRFYITLKPFLYLIILYFFSELKLDIDFKKISLLIILFYPAMLLWSVILFYFQTGTLLKRPYFIFENNFEIPFLLACFITLTFIYKIIDLRIYAIVAISVLLTGSRSGLIGFVGVSIPYFFLLGKKFFFLGVMISISTIIYLYFIRGSEAFNVNAIDRIQTLKGILNFYDNSLLNILSYPFGVGIYKKIPADICSPLRVWAEWFTGNIYNCDPILLQSFFTRSLYQLGIYITILIPIAFFVEVMRVANFQIAFLSIIPVLSVSLSAGGFSNGLSFIAILYIVYSYVNSKNDINRYNK